MKELPHAEISQSCCHFARQKKEKRKVSLIVTLSKVTCMTSINASTTNYTCVSDKVPTSNTWNKSKTNCATQNTFRPDDTIIKNNVMSEITDRWFFFSIFWRANIDILFYSPLGCGFDTIFFAWGSITLPEFHFVHLGFHFTWAMLKINNYNKI